MGKPSIEVCFSPKLFHHYDYKNSNVVVVDILRATTAICTAFANGAEAMIPVPSIDEARKYKEMGYIVAAERDGVKLDFADFGNSPFYFTPERVGGRIVAYSTTNGTQAIAMASEGLSVAIGSFINISAVNQWITDQSNRNVLILCAGWKGRFCTEDALFAGALAERLLQSKLFQTSCDSANVAIDIWNIAKTDIHSYLEVVAQRQRLKRLGLDDVLEYCFTPDNSSIIPVLYEGKLMNSLKIGNI